MLLSSEVEKNVFFHMIKFEAVNCTTICPVTEPTEKAFLDSALKHYPHPDSLLDRFNTTLLYNIPPTKVYFLYTTSIKF